MLKLLKDPILSISIYVTNYLLGQNTDKTNIDSILHISEQLYGYVVCKTTTNLGMIAFIFC